MPEVWPRYFARPLGLGPLIDPTSDRWTIMDRGTGRLVLRAGLELILPQGSRFLERRSVTKSQALMLALLLNFPDAMAKARQALQLRLEDVR